MKFKSEPNNDIGKYIHDAVKAYLSKRHGEFWMDYAEEAEFSMMDVMGDDPTDSELNYLYRTHIVTPFGDEEYLAVIARCELDDDGFTIHFSIYSKDEIGKQGLTEVLDAN